MTGSQFDPELEELLGHVDMSKEKSIDSLEDLKNTIVSYVERRSAGGLYAPTPIRGLCAMYARSARRFRASVTAVLGELHNERRLLFVEPKPSARLPRVVFPIGTASALMAVLKEEQASAGPSYDLAEQFQARLCHLIRSYLKEESAG